MFAVTLTKEAGSSVPINTVIVLLFGYCPCPMPEPFADVAVTMPPFIVTADVTELYEGFCPIPIAALELVALAFTVPPFIVIIPAELI